MANTDLPRFTTPFASKSNSTSIPTPDVRVTTPTPADSPVHSRIDIPLRSLPINANSTASGNTIISPQPGGITIATLPTIDSPSPRRSKSSTPDRDRRPSDDPSVVHARLLHLADSMAQTHQTYFKRFENLYIYNILQYQYELSQLEIEIRTSQGTAGKGVRKIVDQEGHLELTRRLRALLSEYNQALQDASSILSLRTVPSNYSRLMLQEQHNSVPDLPAPGPLFPLPNTNPQHIPYSSNERLLVLDSGLNVSLLDLMSTVSSSLGDKPYIHNRAWQRWAVVRGWNAMVRGSWDSMITTGWFGRFGFGCVGGAFLIVPMVVMLWVEGGRTTQVVTVSVSIFVFVVMMAVVTRGSIQDMFASTAAYAAVLVVFVGVQG